MRKRSRLALLSLMLVLLSLSAGAYSLLEFEKMAIANSISLKKAELILEQTAIDYNRAKHKEYTLPQKTLLEKEKAWYEAEKSLTTMKNQIKIDTKKQALNFIEAKTNLTEKKLQLLKEKRNLTLTEFRYEKGLSSKFELEQQKNKVRVADEALLQAQNALQLQIMKLNQLTGLPLGHDFELEIPTVTLPKLPDKDELHLLLIKKEPSLQKLQNQIEAQSLVLSMAKLQEEAALTIREQEIALELLKLDLITKENEIHLLAEQEQLQLKDRLRQIDNMQREWEEAQAKLVEAKEQFSLGLISLSELEEASEAVTLGELGYKNGSLSLAISLLELGYPTEALEVDTHE